MPTTTALYASLSVLLLVVLGGNTSRLRGKHKSLPGDTSNKEVLLASRAHGNMAEYLGPFIGLLLFAELLGGGSVALHCIGGTFLVARIFHAFGVLNSNVPLITLGAATNYLLLTFAASYGLYLRFLL